VLLATLDVSITTIAMPTDARLSASAVDGAAEMLRKDM
jgi:hypothetical protein